jgi:WXG100 family type VII secretion target
MSFLHKAAVRTTFCMIREVFLSLRQLNDKPEPVLVKEFSTMATIHVNTDLMRQLGQVFVQLNDSIANQIEPQIASHTSSLEGDWQGVSRNRYEQLYQQWRTSTQQAVQAGDDIGRHLQDTATRFEQVDQS